jgi:glucan biosynthesis protein
VKRADAAKAVELRAYVKQASQGAITETWSYVVPPESDKP